MDDQKIVILNYGQAFVPILDVYIPDEVIVANSDEAARIYTEILWWKRDDPDQRNSYRITITVSERDVLAIYHPDIPWEQRWMQSITVDRDE